MGYNTSQILMGAPKSNFCQRRGSHFFQRRVNLLLPKLLPKTQNKNEHMGMPTRYTNKDTQIIAHKNKQQKESKQQQGIKAPSQKTKFVVSTG